MSAFNTCYPLALDENVQNRLTENYVKVVVLSIFWASASYNKQTIDFNRLI